MNLELIEQLVCMKQIATHKFMFSFLKKHYNKVVNDKSFVYAVGDIPIALVAHMDTVFEDSKEQKELFYDQKKQVLWCPQGAGFDDKAGLAAIIEIVNSGLKPHIILTTDEEIGGVGASVLASRKNPFKDLRYFIQLDRRGKDDCVFYDCANDEFTEYVEKFGFSTAWGSFSDISTLCPAWEIAGVNLSIGYEHEHTQQETLKVNWMYDTIEKVKTMLTSEMPNVFKYIEDEFSWKKYYLDYFKTKCAKCGNHYLTEELFVVKSKDGKNELWCPDCISRAKLSWCTSCFQAFETDGEPVIMDNCEDCKKKKELGNNVQGNTATV